MLSDLSQLILRDNYQSVLAAERMKESLERLDSAAIYIVAGERSRADPLAAEHLEKFEQQLRIQERNITEFDQGEDVATSKLRREWDKYRNLLKKYLTLSDLKEMKKQYFDVLQPQFVAVKDAADEVLRINQARCTIEPKSHVAPANGRFRSFLPSQLGRCSSARWHRHSHSTAAPAAVAVDGGGESTRPT